jgi:hypothetical protein
VKIGKEGQLARFSIVGERVPFFRAGCAAISLGVRLRLLTRLSAGPLADAGHETRGRRLPDVEAGAG